MTIYMPHISIKYEIRAAFCSGFMPTSVCQSVWTFKSVGHIRSWLVTFFLLIRDAVTLTFDPLILNDYMYRRSHDQTMCQIWAKSSNPQLSFSDFQIEQVVRARFSKGNFSGLVLRIWWTDLYYIWRVLDICWALNAKFCLVWPTVEIGEGRAKYPNQYLVESSAPPIHVLNFWYDAPFLNQRASKTTGIKNRGQISHFLTPVKFGEG